MENDAIMKAFEGRWRIKSQNLDKALETMLIEHRIDYVKKLCRDFFTAGILIAEQATVPEVSTSGLITHDAEYPDGTPIGKITVMHDPVLDTADQGFETWWDMYGKKIDRAKCEKKWEKLSFAEKQACIAATPAYVASTPDIQFRRHPMTYLNNKSWENQIIPRNNGTYKPTIDQQQSKLADILVG